MAGLSFPAEAISRRSCVVRADERDDREWLQEAPLCPVLGQHHIAHVGILEAPEPFEIARPDQSGTFMLACFGGSGVVRADGQWRKVVAGQACLLPPFVTNAMKTTGAEPWRMCWVRYHESRESSPVVAARSPVLGNYDTAPLLAAIRGLHAECSGEGAAGPLHLWAELIQTYVLRFARPHRGDPRLWKLWEAVERQPEFPWTLDALASRANVCKEHLRRICRSELGRSPMQHVTFLRMQLARHLLATTDDKVETITRAVGYESANTFSNTFYKWVGSRPSDHRRS